MSIKMITLKIKPDFLSLFLERAKLISSYEHPFVTLVPKRTKTICYIEISGPEKDIQNYTSDLYKLFLSSEIQEIFL